MQLILDEGAARMFSSSLGRAVVLIAIIAAGGAALTVWSENVALGFIIFGIALFAVSAASGDASTVFYETILERLENLIRSFPGNSDPRR